MADVTVSVTGQQAIVNPTTWNASNINWGDGSWNVGGAVDQNILQGWGHPAWGQADWGDADYYDTGWGRDNWGSQVWGGTFNVIVTPTGVSATTNLGSVTNVISNVVDLTGQAATSALGSLTIDVSVSQTLTGQAATSAVGTLDPADQVMGLTGLGATSAVGSITPVDQVMGLTGLEATSAVGTPNTKRWSSINRTCCNFCIRYTYNFSNRHC